MFVNTFRFQLHVYGTRKQTKYSVYEKGMSIVTQSGGVFIVWDFNLTTRYNNLLKTIHQHLPPPFKVPEENPKPPQSSFIGVSGSSMPNMQCDVRGYSPDMAVGPLFILTLFIRSCFVVFCIYLQ